MVPRTYLYVCVICSERRMMLQREQAEEQARLAARDAIEKAEFEACRAKGSVRVHIPMEPAMFASPPARRKGEKDKKDSVKRPSFKARATPVRKSNVVDEIKRIQERRDQRRNQQVSLSHFSLSLSLS